mmetsp:Transcript_2371/g.3579  ORF Transcript_2371/g.3579 Transcript_2371/m.3579 type:complete len:124 (-) Transcript_2371:272-643(-)
MDNALRSRSKQISSDDPYRWFARYLLEGKVLNELRGLKDMLNDDPGMITRKKPASKIALLVSALSSKGISSAEMLTKHWAEEDNKFLFKYLKSWVKKEKSSEAKRLWIHTVKKRIARSSGTLE